MYYNNYREIIEKNYVLLLTNDIYKNKKVQVENTKTIWYLVEGYNLNKVHEKNIISCIPLHNPNFISSLRKIHDIWHSKVPKSSTYPPKTWYHTKFTEFLLTLVTLWEAQFQIKYRLAFINLSYFYAKSIRVIWWQDLIW